jgi:dynactin-5
MEIRIASACTITDESRLNVGKRAILRACTIHCDAKIFLGDDCILDSGCVVSPSPRIATLKTSSSSSTAHSGAPEDKAVKSHHQLRIGNGTYIGRDVHSEALSIGRCVHVGAGAVLGAGCILNDCAVVEAGAVLPPRTVVPPYGVVAGNPARVVGAAPACQVQIMRDYVSEYGWKLMRLSGV